jgi:predicted deacylase
MDTAHQQLALGSVSAQPGTRATGLVPLDLGRGASVQIPVALVHARRRPAALVIPAVLAEVGGQGRWPAEVVALHAAGLRRWLRAAGVLADAPDEPRHATEVLPTEAWMRAANTGYWHPQVAVGERIAAGTIAGEVRDAFGQVLERPAAPIDGVVIFLVTSLAMNAGDPLLALAG